MDILTEISSSVQKGEQDSIQAQVQTALDEGLSPLEILNNGLIAGMDVVGEKFKNKEIFIPNVLIAARAMNRAMEVLKPRLAETGAKPAGKYVIGTVLGDHHDIGKNLVRMMLQGKGFEVVDLGINVPPQRFVEAITEDTDIVGMSALLSTTRPLMKDTIDAIEAAGLRDRVKVMVGGGAITEAYASEIGADGYGSDAILSAELALRLVGQKGEV